MTYQLPLTTVINVSVSQTPTGISAFNTSNLALFTGDTPATTFGSGAYKIYLEPTDVATDFGTSSVTYKMALAVFSQAPNILAAGGYLVVIPYQPSETLAAALARTATTVQYFGVMSAAIESQSDMLAAAAVIQANPLLIGFFVQRTTGSIDPGGSLDLLRSGAFSQSRGLFYGSAADLDALLMQAAYAGRALSTNFSGSNTTQTMQLKSLATISPDPTLTVTLFNKAQTAGVDVYASVQGVSAALTSGENRFFDQVYNLGWFVGALEVAGFNFLRQTGTKLPQTEAGMDGLKGAYRSVCSQAVQNQYAAPGTWTSPTTFGNQADLIANIAQVGYYIYSSPIATQLQANRAARQAPLVQIALKEAGAIHSSSVIINVNA